MTVTPRGDSFQVSVYVNGKRRRKDVATLSEADQLNEQWEREAGLARVSAAPVAVPVPKAIREKTAKAVRHERITHFGPLVREVMAKRWNDDSSYKTSVININTALKFFGEDYPLHGFSKETLDSYTAELEKSGLANATINRKQTALNVCLKYARERGWLAEVPKMDRQTETGYRDRVITQQEEVAMAAYFERIGRPDLADAVTIMLDTGLRVRVELLALTTGSVTNIPFAAVHVIGKGSKPRTVPLTARAKLAIERRVTAANAAGTAKLFDMSYRTFVERWGGMAAALGLQDDEQFIPHTCRHTCASRLADALVPAQQIQKWLGHSDITTTMRYVHASAASLSVGVSALEGLQAQHALDNVTKLAACDQNAGHTQTHSTQIRKTGE